MQPRKEIVTDTRTHWAIDPTHTTVEFAVKNLFLFTVNGSLAVQSGELVLDASDVGGSSVTASLEATSINTSNKRRDEHLRAAAFLDAEHCPEIRFQSTKVEPGMDRDTLRVTGTLTIRERTKEIVLEVSDIDRSCSPNGEQVAYFTALTDLDRHDFGISSMRGLIGGKLKVTINLQATRRV